MRTDNSLCNHKYWAEQSFQHYSTFLDRFANPLPSPLWQLYLRQQRRRKDKRERGRQARPWGFGKSKFCLCLCYPVAKEAFVFGRPSPGPVCQTPSALTKEGRALSPKSYSRSQLLGNKGSRDCWRNIESSLSFRHTQRRWSSKWLLSNYA